MAIYAYKKVNVFKYFLILREPIIFWGSLFSSPKNQMHSLNYELSKTIYHSIFVQKRKKFAKFRNKNSVKTVNDNCWGYSYRFIPLSKLHLWYILDTSCNCLLSWYEILELSKLSFFDPKHDFLRIPNWWYYLYVFIYIWKGLNLRQCPRRWLLAYFDTFFYVRGEIWKHLRASEKIRRFQVNVVENSSILICNVKGLIW